MNETEKKLYEIAVEYHDQLKEDYLKTSSEFVKKAIITRIAEIRKTLKEYNIREGIGCHVCGTMWSDLNETHVCVDCATDPGVNDTGDLDR